MTKRFSRILGLGLLLAGLACSGGAVMAQTEVGVLEDDPLGELAAMADFLSDDGPDAGGSIRAKQEADVDRSKRLKDPRNISAKVEGVKRGTFPTVALKLKVTKPAKQGVGKDVAKNSVIVVIPDLKVRAAKTDFSDGATVLNTGAFYLNRGDKIVVRLGKKTGKYWTVEYIERK